MIIQILTHHGRLIGLNNEGTVFERTEYDDGWYWEEMPTEFLEE